MEIALGQKADAHQITERMIHKAIEEKVVPTKKGSRVTVDAGAVFYIVSMHKLENCTLSPQGKRHLYAELANRVWSGEVDVELSPGFHFHPAPSAVRRLRTLVRKYLGHRRYVVCDPEILGGVPIVRGTRIPAHSVLSRIEGGDSIESLLEDYPEVKREAFEAAVGYARTHPKRGRPKRRYR
jgi:uncharacterized protein (DUF433 family)